MRSLRAHEIKKKRKDQQELWESQGVIMKLRSLLAKLKVLSFEDTFIMSVYFHNKYKK